MDNLSSVAEVERLFSVSDQYWSMVTEKFVDYAPRVAMGQLPPLLYRVSNTLRSLHSGNSFTRHQAWAALIAFWQLPQCAFDSILSLLAVNNNEEVRCLALRTIAMYSYRERSIPLYLVTAIECWRKSYDPQSAPSPVLHSLSGFDCKIEKEFKNDGQHRESLKAMWSKKIGMENVQALTSSFVEAKAGITHPDEFVRIVAAGILRIYWPAETKQLRTHLCLMLQSDSSPRVRAAVAGLLASLYVHSDDKELEAIFLRCFSNLTGADDFRKGVYTAMLSLRGIPTTVWPLSVAFGTSEWESDTDKGFIASFENE